MARIKLRIIIPLLQVLILVLAFSLDPLLGNRYVTRSDLDIAYVVTPQRLAMKLNFPLVIIGAPLLYASFSVLPESSHTGAIRNVILGGYLLAIMMSTAAFWYLVVVEAETRKHNNSFLRFSWRHLEKLKAAVFILIGVGAAAYALRDGHRLVVLDSVNGHNLFWSCVVADALIGGLFLFGWAAALIAMGVQDLVRVSQTA